MSSTWRTVRVFISSTFSDMHAERDYLVKVIFPALRVRLRKHQVHLVDVDLRWGVTKEQADNDLALDLCLKHIDDCRPFFIGILGERYGFVPPRAEGSSENRYGWIQEMTGKSITELEIIYGVLGDQAPKSNAFFYFRDPSFLADVPEPKRSEMLSEHSQFAAMQADLKQRIVESGAAVETYKCRYRGLKLNWRLAKKKLTEGGRRQLASAMCDGVVEPKEYGSLPPELQSFVNDESIVYLGGLQSFGNSVRDQAWDAIAKSLNLTEPTPDSTADSASMNAASDNDQEQYIEARLRTFVGREDTLQSLLEYVKDSCRKPMLVTGETGSGKSAALARFVSELQREHPDDGLVYHFVGSGPGSASLPSMLRRCCERLIQLLQIDVDIAQDALSLSRQFRDLLSEAEQPVVVVLDGIDQLASDFHSHKLNWIPRSLASGVKLIVSMAEVSGETTVIAHAINSIPHERETIRPLTNQERRLILRQVPSLSAKALDEVQAELLLSNPASRNPLFLQVALEELRGFGTYHQLTDRIRDLPREGEIIRLIFLQVLERLSEDFGGKIVERLFSLLAVARHGLTEAELRELVESQESLFFILNQVRPYMQIRGDRIDFFHRGLSIAASDAYLSQPSEKLAAHRRLSQYFASSIGAGEPADRELHYRRMTAELPFHLLGSQDWDSLERTLCNLRFIAAKCLFNQEVDLFNDFASTLDALPGLEVQRERERRQKQKFSEYASQLIAIAKSPDRTADPPPPPEPVTANSDDFESMLSSSDHASRLLCFSHFFSSNAHALSHHAQDAIRIAYNHAADGVVVQQAEAFLNNQQHEWLRREFRPAAAQIPPMHERTLVGHTSKVSGIAVTPDGSIAVSSSWDKTVRLWDVATGEQLRVFRGHTENVSDVDISLDGGIVVSSSWDKTVRIWDVRTGETLHVLEGHTQNVSAVAISADGGTVVSASWDSTTRRWDTHTGRQLNKFGGDQAKSGYIYGVYGIKLSPNGNRAFVTWQKFIQVLNVDITEREGAIGGHSSEVISVDATPDGRVGISVSDQQLCVWNGRTAASAEILATTDRRFTAAAITPDGNFALVAESNDLQLWHIETGELTQVFEGHFNAIDAIAVTYDSQRAITGGSDNSIRIWNLKTRNVFHQSTPRHRSKIRDFAFSRVQTHVVSGSSDSSLRVWNHQDGACVRTLQGHESPISAVAMAPEGPYLLSGDFEGVIKVWDVSNYELQHEFQAHEGMIYDIQHLRDGGLVYTSASDRKVKIWNTQDWSEATMFSGGDHYLATTTVTPDEQYLIAGRGDYAVCIWDLKKFTLSNVLSGHTKYIDGLAVSPDNQLLASASHDGDLRIWNLPSGDLKLVLRGHRQAVNSVQFFDDGQYLLSTSHDATLCVWNSRSGEITQRLVGHRQAVNWAVMTPNGRVVSASLDETLRLWDLRSGETLSVQPINGICTSLQVAPDGRIVAAVNGRLEYFTIVLGN